jgi:hypothetical protein
MTSLTDRYVWSVLRAIPESQRSDLEPEIRALVADATEARTAAGETSPEAAERAALLELGDPELLAARYSDRHLYLIGPALFLEWRRLLMLLLPIVVPIVGIVVGTANLFGGSTVGEAIVAGLGAAFTAAVQLVFWITLIFAIMERAVGRRSEPMRNWSLDDLPDVPDSERLGAVELVMSLVASLFVAGAILWLQLQPPILIDGRSVPLFDPALWSFWLPWFLVITLLEIAFTVALYLRGRWTWPFAVANAALGAAFAIPAIWLLLNDLLLNPVLVAELEATVNRNWLEATTVIMGSAIVVIVTWDAVEGFVKAYRNTAHGERATA